MTYDGRGVGVKCETDVTLVSQAPMSTPLRCTGKCVCASLCVYKKPHLREGFPWTPVLFRLISLRGKEMMASVKEEREGRDGGRSVCVYVGGSPPFPSICEREDLMWDEHIRLFIRPIYFQPSGFMVIGKALPSLPPSQKESIFLPLLHFSVSASFSLIQYFLQNTSLPFMHGQGMLEGIWGETKHSDTMHTQTEVWGYRTRCQQWSRKNSRSGCLSPPYHSYPSLLRAVMLTNASLSVFVRGSCGALETDCGLFTTLMFANDF